MAPAPNLLLLYTQIACSFFPSYSRRSSPLCSTSNYYSNSTLFAPSSERARLAPPVVAGAARPWLGRAVLAARRFHGSVGPLSLCCAAH